jgi:hypothetical protein
VLKQLVDVLVFFEDEAANRLIDQLVAVMPNRVTVVRLAWLIRPFSFHFQIIHV